MCLTTLPSTIQLVRHANEPRRGSEQAKANGYRLAAVSATDGGAPWAFVRGVAVSATCGTMFRRCW
jgi:hypothetical protein